MILTENHYMMSLEDAGGVAEGIKFLAVIFLVIFLMDCLLVLVTEEGKRELPVRSYLAYLVTYFLYRIAII